MPLFYDLFRHEPRITKVPAGAMLFHQGDPCNGKMYVLLSGRADILIGSRVVEHMDPGAILGEIAMVESVQRCASALATTDCEFAEIDQKRFNFLVTQTPYFATEVMRVMARRLRHCGVMLA